MLYNSTIQYPKEKCSRTHWLFSACAWVILVFFVASSSLSMKNSHLIIVYFHLLSIWPPPCKHLWIPFKIVSFIASVSLSYFFDTSYQSSKCLGAKCESHLYIYRLFCSVFDILHSISQMASELTALKSIECKITRIPLTSISVHTENWDSYFESKHVHQNWNCYGVKCSLSWLKPSQTI